MSPATASLLAAGFAKSIELSFVTVFVTFLGQVLSRRALIKRSRGITISEMSMRQWIMQVLRASSPFVPMLTSKPIARHAHHALRHRQTCSSVLPRHGQSISHIPYSEVQYRTRSCLCKSRLDKPALSRFHLPQGPADFGCDFRYLFLAH